MDIWSILLLFDIFNVHLVYFVLIWYIFPWFGILYQEKSGNPDQRNVKKDGDIRKEFCCRFPDHANK
jgi:hypothetical protein